MSGVKFYKLKYKDEYIRIYIYNILVATSTRIKFNYSFKWIIIITLQI